MRTFSHLAAFSCLLMLATSSSATCNVTHDQLVALVGKDLAVAQAVLEGPKHQCVVALNGQLDGFSRWREPPHPTGYRWAANTVVITTKTGQQDENNRLERHILVRHAVQARCSDDKASCALQPSQQLPGREDFRYRAFASDVSVIPVLVRIAEEDGLMVQWGGGAQEALSKMRFDWQAFNRDAALARAHSSSEAFRGVGRWYAASGATGQFLACLHQDVVVVRVGGGVTCSAH